MRQFKIKLDLWIFSHSANILKIYSQCISKKPDCKGFFERSGSLKGVIYARQKVMQTKEIVAQPEF